MPIQKLFYLNISGHGQGLFYSSSLRISFEGVWGEGLSPKAWRRLIERKSRLMNAGSSMKPRKAQVKDKGLGAKSWDFSGAF